MGLYPVPGTITALTTAFKTGAGVYASASPTRRGLVTHIMVGQSTNYSSTDTMVNLLVL